MMKNWILRHHRRLLAVLFVLIVLIGWIGVVTRGRWRPQLMSASVTVNGQKSWKAAVYQMPNGDWLVAPHEEAFWGESTAYLVPRAGDEIGVLNVNLQNLSYFGRFDFMIFPFAVYQDTRPLRTVKLGGTKADVNPNFVREPDKLEFTSMLYSRIRIRLR
ncbi:MAG: hypothetical protein ABIY70_02105 [Capsulimonas sp.]|uniref:hypothetical protein n=1 Tax=Capsulimonas sp. TaxID=2494211 RepID=UPI003267496E